MHTHTLHTHYARMHTPTHAHTHTLTDHSDTDHTHTEELLYIVSLTCLSSSHGTCSDLPVHMPANEDHLPHRAGTGQSGAGEDL